MAFADRFKSLIKKTPGAEPETKKAPAPAAQTGAPPPPKSPEVNASASLQDLENRIAQEKSEGEARSQVIENEIRAIQMNIEKTELASKSQRDSHQQTLVFLQQDADREIKFLERKLQEDLAAWNRQLTDREKALEQVARDAESAQQEKKTLSEKENDSRAQALNQAEETLNEQEKKLGEERQRWRDAIQAKDAALLSLKQELSRREAALDVELKEQENQRRAAQELWATRTKEIERQWNEKRKSWEEAVKAKEEERVRLQAAFHERQAAWQLEQERRLQEMARRQEKAAEKVAALKAHLVKETQVWQQLTQNREDNVQQLKVKLLLSETESKTQIEQAHKILQEAIASAAAQVQALQHQLQEEQEIWKKALDNKTVEIQQMQAGVRAQVRQLEADYSQRIAAVSAQKEQLNQEAATLDDQYKAAQQLHEERVQQLRDEQNNLQLASQNRLESQRQRLDEETAALQTQISALENQKEGSARELEALRVQWQEQLQQRDQALKEIQAALAPQEAELRKRFTVEEEAFNRQIEALKARSRALERDIQKTQESKERLELEHTATIENLRKDTADKEEALKRRATEQMERLSKRLEERRLALDSFLAMKKEEETKIQSLAKAKEKERADLASRLAHLPQIYEAALQQKKEAIKKESDALRERIAALEQEATQARDQAKGLIQSKSNELAALRQALEAKQNELAAAFREREQIMEAERAGIEKKTAAAQVDIERLRSHWKAEAEKREKDIGALQNELRQQNILHEKRMEQEQKEFDQQLAPLQAQREELIGSLEREQHEHARKLQELDKQAQACRAEMEKAAARAKTETAEQQNRFRQAHAQWKAQFDGIRGEQEGIALSGRAAVEQKLAVIKNLEEQVRQQTLAHEASRRDAVEQATLKIRALQEAVSKLQQELEQARASFPPQLQAKDDAIVQLNQKLASEQVRHQHLLARFERASTTLARRGKKREEMLMASLASAKEQWNNKLADRDSEIAALQANLVAKESERQGELDRMAKQFAEERFQLEKAKEEVEWKLKDHKEVSERQLAGRQKEIHFLEAEILRLKAQRDEQIGQKTAMFAAEKQTWQASLSALQKQAEEQHKSNEAVLVSKEQELQNLIAHSKHRLKTLGEEFTQKVNSWRGTNETLTAQIEQFKSQWAQAQNEWEALRKEKTAEIADLRQEIAACEQRTETELTALEQTNEEGRQTMANQLRKQEKDLQDAQSAFKERLLEKEEALAAATEEISARESASELKWQTSLEQWQNDKQALQQEKARFEHDLNELQKRSERELRKMEETAAQLHMDVTFKEAQLTTQKERLAAQIQQELDPLRDRLSQMKIQEAQERKVWETRLNAKEEDLKMVKTRLVWREKRLQDEFKRREKELEGLRLQFSAESQKVRSHYEAERKQIEQLLKEKRDSLNELQRQSAQLRKGDVDDRDEGQKTLLQQRTEMEEAVRHLTTQREELKTYYEALLEEKEYTLTDMKNALDVRDKDLAQVREKASRRADEIRKQLEQLREATTRESAKSGPKSAIAWTAFEKGIHLYQTQKWDEAIRAFEECIKKDAHWGPGYQYLALSYHAQGDNVRAAAIAQRALEQDPTNSQLSAWITRLQASIDLKDHRAAS